MTETQGNDYVATAAAEKRLREILAVRFDHELPDMADQMAEILLADTQIEYKSRAKAVVITIALPDKAELEKTRKTAEPDVDDGSTGSAEYGDKQSYDEAQLARVYGGQPAVTPGIRPFVPVPEPEEGYDDDPEFQFA